MSRWPGHSVAHRGVGEGGPRATGYHAAAPPSMTDHDSRARQACATEGGPRPRPPQCDLADRRPGAGHPARDRRQRRHGAPPGRRRFRVRLRRQHRLRAGSPACGVGAGHRAPRPGRRRTQPRRRAPGRCARLARGRRDPGLRGSGRRVQPGWGRAGPTGGRGPRGGRIHPWFTGEGLPRGRSWPGADRPGGSGHRRTARPRRRRRDSHPAPGWWPGGRADGPGGRRGDGARHPRRRDPSDGDSGACPFARRSSASCCATARRSSRSASPWRCGPRWTRCCSRTWRRPRWSAGTRRR